MRHPPPSATPPRGPYRAQLREEVLRQPLVLGIVASSNSRELSDAQLELVVAGQAAAGGAPSDSGPAADSTDPELTALNRVLVEKEDSC